jgi:hypothetical protein
MVLAVDHAAGEGLFDQLGERLLRPLRIGERIKVAGAFNLVGLNAFFFARGDLSPQSLGLFACLQV